MTETALFERATHAHCVSCGVTHGLSDLGITLHGEDEVDDLYEFVDCCSDPYLEAQVIGPDPVFGVESVDSDYYIAPSNGNPGVYVYDLNDTLMDLPELEGVLVDG